MLGHKYHDIDRAPLVEQRERLRRNTVKCLDKQAKELSIFRPGTQVSILQDAASLTAADGLATGS